MLYTWNAKCICRTLCQGTALSFHFNTALLHVHLHVALVSQLFWFINHWCDRICPRKGMPPKLADGTLGSDHMRTRGRKILEFIPVFQVKYGHEKVKCKKEIQVQHLNRFLQVSQGKKEERTPGREWIMDFCILSDLGGDGPWSFILLRLGHQATTVITPVKCNQWFLQARS